MRELIAGKTIIINAGHDENKEVIITGIGLSNILFAPLPLIRFNGTLIEQSMPTMEFKKLALMEGGDHA